MSYFLRVLLALVGGLVALAMMLVFLAFLISGEPSVPVARTSYEYAPRDDFERVGDGVIVPVSAADEVLNQCSRVTVSPIEGFWRPEPAMVLELESRLPLFLMYEARLRPLASYVRQYAGVISRGRPVVYASFLASNLGDDWQNQPVILCDGGNSAWGVAFDIGSKTFGEVNINGAKSGAVTPIADAWLGRWRGPEGTFLLLEGGEGTYRVTVQNLDGSRTFDGTAAGDRLQFERDGVVESVRATNGAETGMKWLSDKAKCLTVRAGEGYCRD
jgi:hypothetical protein